MCQSIAIDSKMKDKFIKFFMEVAKSTSFLSHARRLKVGAVVVKDRNIVAFGYNGMPEGMDNNCEEVEHVNMEVGGWYDPGEIEEQWPLKDSNTNTRYRLKTKPEVIHAEANAIAKLARTTNSADGADIFITHAPCVECSKLILQSGIKRVYYNAQYRDDAGIQLLHKAGVTVTQVEEIT